MNQRYNLNDSAQVVLNAVGFGMVSVGPGRPGTKWRIKLVALSTSTATKIPIAKMYLGEPAAGNLLGGTYTGNQDSTETEIELFAGQKLTVTWENGDVGARATLSYYGEIFA